MHAALVRATVLSRPAQVTVNLDHLRHNFALARHHAGGACVMARVKANAYGHGAVAVARALSAADAFGVAVLEEALALRAAGIAQSILLAAGFFGPDELPEIAHHDFQIVVHSEHQIETLRAARLSRPLVVWLKIDSGMHRLGIAPEAVDDGLIAAWRQLSERALEPNAYLTPMFVLPISAAPSWQRRAFRHGQAGDGVDFVAPGVG